MRGPLELRAEDGVGEPAAAAAAEALGEAKTEELSGDKLEGALELRGATVSAAAASAV